MYVSTHPCTYDSYQYAFSGHRCTNLWSTTTIACTPMLLSLVLRRIKKINQSHFSLLLLPHLWQPHSHHFCFCGADRSLKPWALSAAVESPWGSSFPWPDRICLNQMLAPFHFLNTSSWSWDCSFTLVPLPRWQDIFTFGFFWKCFFWKQVRAAINSFFSRPLMIL